MILCQTHEGGELYPLFIKIPDLATYARAIEATHGALTIGEEKRFNTALGVLCFRENQSKEAAGFAVRLLEFWNTDIKRDRAVYWAVVTALRHAGFKAEMKISAEQQHPAFQVGTDFLVYANGVCVGEGAVASALLITELGISGKQNIGVVNIDIDTLADVRVSQQKFLPLPEYPTIQRDLAIVITENIVYKEIEKTIRSASSAILESLELFDIFRGHGVPVGNKSLAFHLTFRSAERTLTNKEADDEIKKIIAQLQKNHAARVRE